MQEGPALDVVSVNWLGNSSRRDKVVGSGLWNRNHVDEAYETGFLAVFEEHVRKMLP